MKERVQAKIGVFGIGLVAYWPQFEGLKARLEEHQRVIEQRISDLGAEVISAGLVDMAPAARAAGDQFAGENVSLLINRRNSRLKFKLDPAEFMNRSSEEGPTHHCTLRVGNQVGIIKKLARFLELELVVID